MLSDDLSIVNSVARYPALKYDRSAKKKQLQKRLEIKNNMLKYKLSLNNEKQTK